MGSGCLRRVSLLLIRRVRLKPARCPSPVLTDGGRLPCGVWACEEACGPGAVATDAMDVMADDALLVVVRLDRNDMTEGLLDGVRLGAMCTALPALFIMAAARRSARRPSSESPSP